MVRGTLALRFGQMVGAIAALSVLFGFLDRVYTPVRDKSANVTIDNATRAQAHSTGLDWIGAAIDAWPWFIVSISVLGFVTFAIFLSRRP